MNIQEFNKHYCNRQLAKKLKELGVDQDKGFFYWHTPMLAPDWVISASPGDRELCCCPEHYTAFSAGELGELLPDCIFSWKVNNPGEDTVWYCANDEPLISNAFKAETESDARALLLIHFIENKLYGY